MKLTLGPWVSTVVVSVLILSGGAVATAQNTFPGSGAVGIGTMTPAGLFQVNGTGRTDLYFNAPLQNNVLVNFQAGGQTRFSLYRPASTSDFAIDSNAMPNVLYLTNDGRVGVGTNNPATKLHVAGSVQADGNIAAKYQDVAEWVKTAGHLPSATVVIIDPKEPNRVAISDKACSTKVVRVRSTS